MVKRVGCESCEEPKDLVIVRTAIAYAKLSEVYTSEGHCVVLPSSHYETLDDIPACIRTEMDAITCRVMKILEKKYGYTDFVIWENNGPSRSVQHYHRHIIGNFGKNSKHQPVKLNIEGRLEKEELVSLTKILKGFI